jgi:prepilin-type N-terminal cleavage/methylation domain-containing protein/prepilin-type processing-associated H-X9-DG protein
MQTEQTNMAKNSGHGFTLVELLVVIGIITLLLGILMPVVNRIKGAAKSVACRANLHSVAEALRMYLGDNHDFMPPAANWPYDLFDSAQTVYTGRPPIVFYLGSYLGMSDDELAQVTKKKVYTKVLSCPGDRNISAGTGQYGMPQYYFKAETTSYEYKGQGRGGLGGKMLDRRAFRSGIKVSDLEAMSDFDAFHGKKPVPKDNSEEALAEAQANTIGSFNYLFADCHVGDRKGF